MLLFGVTFISIIVGDKSFDFFTGNIGKSTFNITSLERLKSDRTLPSFFYFPYI